MLQNKEQNVGIGKVVYPNLEFLFFAKYFLCVLCVLCGELIFSEAFS